MRRLSSKSKKGKGANANAANDSNKEPVQETENQGNENEAPSDAEESSSDRKVSLNHKKDKRGKKNAGSKDEHWDDEENSSKKNKRGRKSAVGRAEDDDDEGSDDVPLNSKTKKGKKGQSDDNEVSTKEEPSDKEEHYEVEKVVDCKMQSGVRQYKIRWKGFEEDQDTWESEKNLDCPELIEAYLNENPDAFKKPVTKANSKLDKKRKKASQPAQPKEKKQRVVEPVAKQDGQEVYEVEKVVEVHFKKNGDREFLIRWKGFGSDDDTWEPESNLDCPELIEKFMQKVEKAKEATIRELRTNPQVTNRFTLTSPDSGRRLSSRYTSKQRTTYFNAE